jgi:NADPH:quinone reductase-like Zn-dependent oxidoreductase
MSHSRAIQNKYLFIAYEVIYTFYLIYKYLFIAIYRLMVPSHYRSKSVRGETILITGSGSGIGKLLSKKFARLGAKLVLVDIDEAANHKTANEILIDGGIATTFKCDLSKREDIYKVADEVEMIFLFTFNFSAVRKVYSLKLSWEKM